MKKTIADYPNLVIEWHPTLNRDLIPSNVSYGSKKKIWWQCDKGHEWKITCKERTREKATGCPYCVNQKVCKDNCLATTHPELVKEWHPTLNEELTPHNIVAGSHKKYWWLCNKGHEWKISCSKRTFNKSSCPYCSNR